MSKRKSDNHGSSEGKFHTHHTFLLGTELDWFMFETRMRTLVREILEPIIERND